MGNAARTAIVCLALAVLPLASLAEKPKKGPKVARVSLADWYSIEGPNFTLYGSSDKRSIVDFAKRVLSFAEVARTTTNIDRFDPRLPIRIILFDSSDYLRLWGRSGGMMHPGLSRFTLIVNADIGNGVQVLLHEYTHYLIHNQGVSYPRWFDEGFAELISTVRFREDMAFIGAPPAWRVQQLQRDEPLLPLRRVLGARGYPEGKALYMFYAQAWLLTHYLHTAHAYGDPSLIGSMQRYLEYLHANTPWATAYDQAFELSIEELETRLEAHRKRLKKDETVLPMLSLEIGLPDTCKLRMHRIEPARVAEVIGDTAFSLRGGDRLAENFYRASIDLDSNRTGAMAGLAAVLASQGRTNQARELAEAAVEAAPDSSSFRLTLGRVLYSAATADEPRDLTLVEEARSIYRELMKTDPAHPAAFVSLAESYLDSEEDVSEGIAALERIGAATPDLVPGLTLGKLYRAAGRRKEAREQLRMVVRWHPGDDADEARMLLKEIADEDVDELLDETAAEDDPETESRDGGASGD